MAMNGRIPANPVPPYGLYDPAYEHDACGSGFWVAGRGRSAGRTRSLRMGSRRTSAGLDHRGAERAVGPEAGDIPGDGPAGIHAAGSRTSFHNRAHGSTSTLPARPGAVRHRSRLPPGPPTAARSARRQRPREIRVRPECAEIPRLAATCPFEPYGLGKRRRGRPAPRIRQVFLSATRPQTTKRLAGNRARSRRVRRPPAGEAGSGRAWEAATLDAYLPSLVVAHHRLQGKC